MKNKLTLLVSILLLGTLLSACGPTTVYTQSEPPMRTITVTGTGSVTLIPDLAYVTIGVQTQDASASTAMSDNNSRAQALVAAIKSFDVEVKLLPLISKDVQVKRFVVDGLRLGMEKNKEGRGNWEGLGKRPDKAPPAPPKDTARKPEEKAEVGLPITGLEVGEFAGTEKPVLESLRLHLAALVIGTGNGAGTAADALLRIDHDDAVRPRIGCAARAYLLAGRILAVIAERRDVHAVDGWIHAVFLAERAREKHAIGQRVFLLAADHAGIAADAALEVEHHAIACHQCFLPLPGLAISSTRS